MAAADPRIPFPFPLPPLFLVFSPLFADGFPLQYAGDRDSSSRRRRIRGSAKGSFIPPKKFASRRARHRTFSFPKPPRLRQRTTLTLCFLCRRAGLTTSFILACHKLPLPPVLRGRSWSFVEGGSDHPPEQRSTVLVARLPPVLFRYDLYDAAAWNSQKGPFGSDFTTLRLVRICVVLAARARWLP